MATEYKITAERCKNICCICFKSTGITEKVEGYQFPFSKFGVQGWFCEKHTDEIESNAGRLMEYENMFGLTESDPNVKIVVDAFIKYTTE